MGSNPGGGLALFFTFYPILSFPPKQLLHGGAALLMLLRKWMLVAQGKARSIITEQEKSLFELIYKVDKSKNEKDQVRELESPRLTRVD